MPMIELTLEEGALTDDARADLVEGLTAALLRAEGAPDNEMSRSIAWLYVDERPAGSINVGGRPADAPRYRVKLTVPEGALDDDEQGPDRGRRDQAGAARPRAPRPMTRPPRSACG